MRLVCVHEEKLSPLMQFGVAIADLTPSGLWGSRYHIVSMSDEQFAALEKIFGKASKEAGYEDMTPEIVAKPVETSPGFLFCRGGKIPNGTKLRAYYLSQLYEAEVRGSRVWLNDKRYDSPSKAARAITKNNVNGWKFWEYYDEQAGKWYSLAYLRRQQSRAAA
jgi:hypothetical protein